MIDPLDNAGTGMPIDRVSKLDVAVEFLRAGIHLYKNGKELFAALHLAGAAEEILGKAIEYQEKSIPGSPANGNALRIAIDSECALEAIILGVTPDPTSIRTRILGPRNSAKHFSKESEDYVEFDARSEAREMLLRAIHNYSCIFFNEDQAIQDFEQVLLNEEWRGP